MNDTQEESKRKTRLHRFEWGVSLLLVLAVIVGAIYLSFTGRMVAMPWRVTDWVEDRLNERIAPLRVNLAQTAVFLTRTGEPRVLLNGVDFYDAADQQVASLRQVTATLRGRSLFTDAPILRHVAIQDAQAVLRRDFNGQLAIVFGEARQSVGRGATLVEVLDQIDAVFAGPLLTAVESIAVEQLSLWYTDDRSGRSWLVDDGLMTLEQTEKDLSLQVFFSVLNGMSVPAEVAMSFGTMKGSLASRLSVSFSDVPSVDLAAQSAALAFLSVIDAPISGAMRTGVDEEGNLTPLNAALEIDRGALRPLESVPPIQFERGRSFFSYDPLEKRFQLSSLEVDTEGLQLRAEGQGFLGGLVDGWPTSLVLQTGFSRIALDPEGVFETPVVFDKGAMDLKIDLDPFKVHLGQLALVGPTGEAYHASGEVEARPDGWRVAVDAQVEQTDRDRVLAFWPLNAVPRTREWLETNIFGGSFSDVNAALRLVPDKEPVISLTFDFSDADVRFMKYMPRARDGSGYASINDNKFTLVVDEATVTPPIGGDLSAAGTVFQIKDIRQKHPPTQINVRSEGPLSATLSLLDQRPLNIMQKANLPVDLAQGSAVSETQIDMILRKGVQTEDIKFETKGTLLSVDTDKLVKGRRLQAERLDLTANNDRIEISGLGTIDGVGLRAAWGQTIGPDRDGGSQLSGRVSITPEALKTFNIALPEGSVSGRGVGLLELNLPKGAPASFQMTSDLDGLALRLPQLNWSSPAAATGSLEVAGTLGQPAQVDRLRLDASGLKLEGSVNLNEDGTLDTVKLDRVRLGGWLDAPVTLRGRGAGGSPAVSITGGLVDLRNLPKSNGAGGGSGGEPIDVALDRLQISDGLYLGAVRGELVPQSRMSGQFSGLVNGAAPIRAALIPAQNGSAIRVRSDNAGEVMRAAGVLQNANGGEMDLILNPLPEDGFYNGNMSVDGPIRVKDASALAELLSALSIVGLLEMLDGEGLSFADLNVDFLLTPNALQITSAAATGPSLGISAAGVFDMGNKRMDIQGVISPIYMFNAVGSIFRRGEGLFGFNYRMKGDPADPKISVNPLSILTPGMFRELFRRPPPQVAQ
ncbi:YhdP family protein [Actibacterium pelagium]|nr:DUF3971 domain-containing protein [Actibacterium pelagium]